MLKWLGAILGLIVLGLAGGLVWLGHGPEPAPQDPPAEQLAKAEEILKDPRWAPPPGWTWGSFAAAQDTRLRFGFAPAAEPGAPVFVFVPGFTAIIEQNFEMLTRLREAGVSVYAVELRGQGGSSRPLADPKDREKTHLADFRLYAEDLAAFLQQEVRPVAAGAPVILGGLSLGGHAVLRTAVETPAAADGYVLVAPAVQPRTPFNAGAVATLTTTLTVIGGGAHYIPSHGPRFWPAERLEGIGSCGADPARAAAMNAVTLVHPETRMGGGTNLWFSAFLRSAALLQNPETLRAVDRPVLLINPQLDHLVVPEVSAAACAAMSACTEVVLETAHHCPFHDPDPEFERAMTALGDFVLGFAPEPVAAAPAPAAAP